MVESPIQDYVQQVLGECAYDVSGSPADYIPELAHADPERFGVALATVDGAMYVAGDSDRPFTIQSISKPFVHALALADRGLEAVSEKVGVEPSGDAFNELSLETETGRPRNPMINAGAIATHALVGDPGLSPDARVARIIEGLSEFAGRDLVVDERACASELETAHRNLAFGHMLRSNGILAEDPDTVVAGYTRQCSVLVTARDLAMMAATLANGGVQPLTGLRVVPRRVARQVLSVMTSCGMYDAAGDWLTTVGIPAKSGVAGGLIGALPGQVGVATFSPRLDEHGHSVRGVSLFQRLSDDMGMHLMEVPAPSRAVLRKVRVFDNEDHTATVYQLQGGIGFGAAEKVVRTVVEDPPTTDRVVFDVERVSSIYDVSRRMLLELVRRLDLAGHEVLVLDPSPDAPDHLAEPSGADSDSDADSGAEPGGPRHHRVVRSRVDLLA